LQVLNRIGQSFPLAQIFFGWQGMCITVASLLLYFCFTYTSLLLHLCFTFDSLMHSIGEAKVKQSEAHTLPTKNVSAPEEIIYELISESAIQNLDVWEKTLRKSCKVCASLLLHFCSTFASLLLSEAKVKQK